MPQMSPLFWFILFSLFSLLLLISMIKIYFSTNEITPQSHKNLKSNLSYIEWTW